MKRNKMIVDTLIYITLFVLMAFSVSAVQAPVDLGSAADFAILSKTGISTTGATSITGDIGVSPIDHTAITGFSLIGDETTDAFLTSTIVTGNIYAANLVAPTPTNLETAVGNMQTAFTNAQGRTTDSSPEDTTELGAGDISGMTIVPGLHKWSSGVLINTGGAGNPDGITLDCSANQNRVFIFQIAQDLTIGPGAKMTLVDCDASNIFWAVDGGSGVSIDTTAHVEGNILASKAISFNTGATINGRILSQTAVTLDQNTVTKATTNNADTTAPVIDSFALSSTELEIGDEVTGTCLATDDVDGQIIGIITGNTSSAGEQTGTCTATDAAGNVATAFTTYTVLAASSNGGSSGGSNNNNNDEQDNEDNTNVQCTTGWHKVGDGCVRDEIKEDTQQTNTTTNPDNQEQNAPTGEQEGEVTAPPAQNPNEDVSENNNSRWSITGALTTATTKIKGIAASIYNFFKR